MIFLGGDCSPIETKYFYPTAAFFFSSRTCLQGATLQSASRSIRITYRIYSPNISITLKDKIPTFTYTTVGDKCGQALRYLTQ